MTAPAVRAAGWGFRHAGRDTWALRNLDLTLEPGERVLLAGPSGAGKSTLLAGLAGLLDAEHSGAEEGTLLVHGHSPTAASGQVGLMFQDPETQLVMARAGDDVAFGLENHAVPSDQIWTRVDQALALVGFPYDRDRPTGYLSGGEKQRLVLAGVQALGPSLLLLDEPTANLDPGGAALVRETVARAVSTTGATMIVIEHRVEEWQELVDRVIVLEPGGGLTADGDPAKVFESEGESLAAQGVWVPGVPLPTAAGSPDQDPQSRRSLLTGEGLSYAYPGEDASVISDVSLQLRERETVAITGPNGAGKSSLALLLAGLVKPTTGTVHQPEHPTPLHRRRARDLVRTVGTVFQDPEHQFLTGSVRAELALGPRQAGLAPEAAQAKVDSLLEKLRLDHLEAANPFTLSGGEKRRLSVATALATSPPVLVLDEPTFGQDRRTWTELLTLLAVLRDDGHAICVVSHDQPFVTALADRELRLRGGRLEGVGS